jgi:formate hydrogenlyase subunit 6/NADH:ubiquinone oxidoreductase subunit I
VDRAAGTWSINRQSCVVCGNCLDVCHKHSLLKTTEGIDTSGIQVYTKPAPAPKPVEEVQKPAEAAEAPVGAGALDGPLLTPTASDAPIGNGVAIDLSTCVFCGLCGKKCPTSAITVDRASKTWTIHRSDCVLCGSCITACPKKSLSEAEIPLQETYTK